MRAVVIFVAVLTLSTTPAFADVRLIVISDPPGATVYTGTHNQDGTITYTYAGGAPVEAKYKTPRRWTTCLTSTPLKVRWVSGAEAVIERFDICPAQTKNQQIVFVRPTEIPGIEIDAQYAAALLLAASAGTNAAQPSQPPVQYQPLKMPQRCTSRLIGNQVFTTCTGG